VLSGLLGEDDGATDLATLEKKLAEKTQQSRHTSQAPGSLPPSPSQAASGQDGHASTPQSSLTSPEPVKEERTAGSPETNKDEKEDVEALSELMCSLVTNQSGETRYIGIWLFLFLHLVL
jgi:hypothetical protein